MDPYLLTLAGTAGTSLVALLVGEGWQQTRDGVVTVWRRFRPQEAEEIERELDASRRTAVNAAQDDGDLERRWSERFAALLDTHPQAAHDLRELLTRRGGQGDGQVVHGGVRLEAHAQGNGRVYQAARDQHIAER
ncbi:hypothetical protein J7I94_14775 [Streptomyces sp. ISL-12]|uniref:hypothetical protein n=1 Tax=Streptomyces sp. ISL-12 TaxID=2819177 RepID=UPI001BEB9BBA|nr:hypothetical protein [Streptomyces sp. ISL-12]MBT2411817.1 hypothetical protein [Streptomyces sp. ISL-12]